MIDFICTGSGTRTHTDITAHQILSLTCLPIPPFRRKFAQSLFTQLLCYIFVFSVLTLTTDGPCSSWSIQKKEISFLLLYQYVKEHLFFRPTGEGRTRFRCYRNLSSKRTVGKAQAGKLYLRCWEAGTRTRIAGVSDRFPNRLEDLPIKTILISKIIRLDFFRLYVCYPFSYFFHRLLELDPVIFNTFTACSS